MALRTIIVEDEPLSMQYISSLLSACPQVQVIAKVSTEDEAISSIKNLNADLVFLDVELHTGNGFEVLKKTWDKNYCVVFTTAINHNTQNLITLSGVPLLQKPLDFDELQNLILHLEKIIHSGKYKIAIEHLIQTMVNNQTPVHIALEKEGEFEYILMKEVIKLKADNERTIFYMHNGTIKSSEKQLRYYESLLEDFSYFRANAEEIVNLENVKQENNFSEIITMTDNSVVHLSPRKTDKYIEALEKFK